MYIRSTKLRTTPLICELRETWEDFGAKEVDLER